MLRSSKFLEKPDPSFRKFFHWTTHKDPKGTVKNPIDTISLPFKPSRGFVKPMKKKKKLASKTTLSDEVADEDFHLLQDFISENFGNKEPTSDGVPEDQVILFSFIQSNNCVIHVCYRFLLV